VPGPLAAGRLALRRGLGLAPLLGVALLVTGTLLTAAPQLPTIVIGLALVTFAFLGTHSVVSGWVSDRAHRVGVGVGQAAGLYLLAYYAGSSVFGSLAAYRWETGGWSSVITVSVGLLIGAGFLLDLARRFDTRSCR